MPSVAIDLSAKLFPAATYSAECRDITEGGREEKVEGGTAEREVRGGG